jgi:signal transduction histidine kinase
MGKRKLRNYLIDPPLQVRIAIECAVAAIVIALLSGGVAFAIVWTVLMEFTSEELIAYHRELIVIGFIFGILGMACVVAALSIVVTHRIAGPIYRIQQDLTGILQGKPVTPIHLRCGDEFHELADLLNQVIAKFIQVDSEAES